MAHISDDSLVPMPFQFFVLWFGFSITRKWKSAENPFFAALLLSCIITEEQKTGRPENEAKVTI